MNEQKAAVSTTSVQGHTKNAGELSDQDLSQVAAGRTADVEYNPFAPPPPTTSRTQPPPPPAPVVKHK